MVVTRILNISAQNMLHNWHYLLLGAVMAAAIQVFLPSGSMSRWFGRAPGVAVLVATAAGALTPLCSCGSVAVMLSLVAAGVPWGPIAAFLVSSPLMSPSMYVLTVGQLGVAFANARLLAAVLMGLAAGYGVQWVEKRGKQRPLRQVQTSLASGSAPTTQTPACGCTKSAQTPVHESMPEEPSPACGCTPETQPPACGCAPETHEPACGCDTPARSPSLEQSLRRMVSETLRQSLFILKYFVVFVIIGSALQVLAPQSLIQALVGAGQIYAVPLAAMIGTPLYVSGIGAIPLMASLVKIGMSSGAALAFTISGAGTSVGACGAVLAVAPRRVFWVYLAVMFLGAILAGYLYNYVILTATA